MEDKRVTREEFRKAYRNAQEDFVKTCVEADDDGKGGLTTFMLGLQNATFASTMEKHLFGDEPIKEDTTIEE